MNLLTRLFIVLLVVCSLLLTASVVVFVTRVEDFRAQNADLNKNLQTTQAGLQDAKQQLVAVRATAEERVKQSETEKENLRQNVARLEQDLAKNRVDLAKVQNDMARTSADMTRLTEALKASEEQKTGLLAQVSELRKSNDALAGQARDLNVTVTEMTNKLDATERQRKYLEEQRAELQAQLASAERTIQEAGIRIGQPAVAQVAPPINGVVRARKQIAGIEYATISVGSSDNVTAGMRFNIINRDTGAFLGELVVDSVQPNEATGRLRGPRVGDIQPGAEVRTQL